MSPKKLFQLSLVFLIIMTLLKVWFFAHTIFANPGIQEIAFWVITAAVAAAVVRRFGVIQFVESGFVIAIWCIGSLVLDLVLTDNFTGFHMFGTAAYWVSFLVIILSVFFFHKKRHIHLRHELHAHNQGNHGHH